MALQYNTVDIPINGKLDMHSDDMDVQAPNLIESTNTMVTTPGKYTKRAGIISFDGSSYRNKGIQSYYPTDTSFGTGTTVSNTAPGMFAFGSTPVSLHKHRVMTHDVVNTSSVQTFHGNHFPYPLEIGPGNTSLTQTQRIVYHGTVRTGDYICRAYTNNYTGYIYLDVWDANTSQHLVRKFQVASDVISYGRVCIAPSDTGLAIAYSTTTSNTVKIVFFTTSTFSTGTPTIVNTVTVSNVRDDSNSDVPNCHMWDFVGSYVAINSSNYFAFAYLHATTGWINVNSYSQTGAAGPHFDVLVTGKVVGNLRVTQNSNGYYVVYDLAAGGTGLCGFPTALTSSLFNTTILATFTGTYTPKEYALTQIDAEGATSAMLCVWISGKDAGSNYATQSSFFNLTTGAEVSSSARYTSYNHRVISRGFILDGKPCVAFGTRDYNNPSIAGGNASVTNVLVVMYDYCIVATTVPQTNRYAPLVIAKFGNDDVASGGDFSDQYEVYVRNRSSAINGQYIDNADGSGGQIHFAYTSTELLNSSTSLITYNNKHFFINLSHRSPVAFQGAELAGYLYLSGACPSLFDGRSVVECGFNEAPYFGGYEESATGSSTLTAGTYLLTYCWAWNDAQSRVHRSQPASPASVTVSAGTRKITISIPRLEHTQKEIDGSAVSAEIYIATPSDPLTYYFHSSVENVQGAAFQNINITSPPSSANRVLYITGGALENDMWPSIGAMCSYQNRIFVVDSEKDQILYSKSFTDEEAPELSLFNSLKINDLGGPVTNIKAKDQLLVAFKNTATYIASGQPANDLGQGANFSEWQPVSQSIGCKSPRATTQTTDGLWFVSNDGPQLFAQGQIANVGQPVSPYAGYEFVAACNMDSPNRKQVMFSAVSVNAASTISANSLGVLLVYDLSHQTWSVWPRTSGGGITTVYYSGLCVPSGSTTVYYGLYNYGIAPSIASESTDYRDYDGVTYVEYNMTIRTGWINFGSQQSLYRLRRAIAKFESKLSGSGSSGTVSTTIYRDYYTSPSDAAGLVATVASYPNNSNLQFRARTATQKIQTASISMVVGYDTSTRHTAVAEIDGLAVEIAQRGGAARLPQTKTANV